MTLVTINGKFGSGVWNRLLTEAEFLAAYQILNERQPLDAVLDDVFASGRALTDEEWEWLRDHDQISLS